MNNTLLKLMHSTGISIPEILLPNQFIDLAKWSVIACDQYTSQYDYWESVYNFVGNSPSTLNLIIPETFIGSSNIEEKLKKTSLNMNTYLKNEILSRSFKGFIYIEREVSNNIFRKGILLAIDLENYDFSGNSVSLIRCTEKTVEDRLPLRIKIRENAILELPHIMLFIDDPNNTVIEPISNKTESLKKVYDFNLMFESSRLRGFKIDNSSDIATILTKIKNLSAETSLKYSYNRNNPFLFAVGDGNHSLAAAKMHWENLKKTLPNNIQNHPARFALVEIVNIYDEAIKFEPINRILFKVNFQNIINDLPNYCTCGKCSIKLVDSFDYAQQKANTLKKHNKLHAIPFMSKDSPGIIIFENPYFNLEVKSLQTTLDKFLMQNNDVKIDYIHGKNDMLNLCKYENTIGFYLPSINKSDLFKNISQSGPYPRKTFSVGTASEKRFYLECRKIV